MLPTLKFDSIVCFSSVCGVCKFVAEIMSSRRARPVSRFTEDEVNDLILKLQTLLPASGSRCNRSVSSASEVLKETCNYIKNLHREVGDLSERLSQLLASGDITTVDADIIRTLLKQ